LRLFALGLLPPLGDELIHLRATRSKVAVKTMEWSSQLARRDDPEAALRVNGKDQPVARMQIEALP
jgi:hypothetical protein